MDVCRRCQHKTSEGETTQRRREVCSLHSVSRKISYRTFLRLRGRSDILHDKTNLITPPPGSGGWPLKPRSRGFESPLGAQLEILQYCRIFHFRNCLIINMIEFDYFAQKFFHFKSIYYLYSIKINQTIKNKSYGKTTSKIRNERSDGCGSKNHQSGSEKN